MCHCPSFCLSLGDTLEIALERLQTLLVPVALVCARRVCAWLLPSNLFFSSRQLEVSRVMYVNDVTPF